MDSKTEGKTVFIIGILAILIWLPYLSSAYPFSDFPKTADPVMHDQVIKTFIKAYIIIGIGVLGGALLLLNKKAGYLLTIAMAIYIC